MHATDEAVDHLQRLDAGHAQHARGNGAHAAHAPVGVLGNFAEHVPRDQGAIHRLRAERIGRDMAVAKPHDQDRLLALAMEHACDFLSQKAGHGQARVHVAPRSTAAHSSVTYRPTALLSACPACSLSTMTSVRVTPMFSQWLTFTPGMSAAPGGAQGLHGQISADLPHAKTPLMLGFDISLPKFFNKMCPTP